MSTSDWYLSGTLNADTYVSAPYAVRNSGYSQANIYKGPINAREGQLISWHYGKFDQYYPAFFFRVQNESALTDPCYRVWLSNHFCRWGRWQETESPYGAVYPMGDLKYDITINNYTWQKFKIIWWEGLDIFNRPATCLKGARWTGSSWAKFWFFSKFVHFGLPYGWDYEYDYIRFHEGSSRNSVGVGGVASSGYQRNDDTEIYTIEYHGEEQEN